MTYILLFVIPLGLKYVFKIGYWTVLYVTHIDGCISVHYFPPPLDKESFYPLIDVNWWVDSAVILARCSGALTVSSVKTLKNLLGKSCEWFEPSPQVTATHDGGFLSLEVILPF